MPRQSRGQGRCWVGRTKSTSITVRKQASFSSLSPHLLPAFRLLEQPQIYTHAHARKHAYVYTHIHIYTLTYLSHIHTYPHTNTLTYTHINTRSHTHALSSVDCGGPVLSCFHPKHTLKPPFAEFSYFPSLLPSLSQQTLHVPYNPN